MKKAMERAVPLNEPTELITVHITRDTTDEHPDLIEARQMATHHKGTSMGVAWTNRLAGITALLAKEPDVWHGLRFARIIIDDCASDVDGYK